MIQFKSVTKNFGRIKALDNISINFPKGKITGLFGPNGAGKSTTMKMIIGLNKPDMGEVLIDDKLPQEKKSKIAYLPEINHLCSWWTLEEAADFTRAFYADFDDIRYKEILEFLRLEEDMILSKISKGQLAKCKLAITLSRKAEYLLMDEPLSGIDILTREEIVNALIRDYGESEQTIIISTHEIDEIENLVDHVFFIDKGSIKISGEADELRSEKGLSLSGIMKEAFRNAEK